MRREPALCVVDSEQKVARLDNAWGKYALVGLKSGGERQGALGHLD